MAGEAKNKTSEQRRQEAMTTFGAVGTLLGPADILNRPNVDTTLSLQNAHTSEEKRRAALDVIAKHEAGLLEGTAQPAKAPPIAELKARRKVPVPIEGADTLEFTAPLDIKLLNKQREGENQTNINNAIGSLLKADGGYNPGGGLRGFSGEKGRKVSELGLTLATMRKDSPEEIDLELRKSYPEARTRWVNYFDPDSGERKRQFIWKRVPDDPWSPVFSRTDLATGIAFAVTDPRELGVGLGATAGAIAGAALGPVGEFGGAAIGGAGGFLLGSGADFLLQDVRGVQRDTAAEQLKRDIGDLPGTLAFEIAALGAGKTIANTLGIKNPNKLSSETQELLEANARSGLPDFFRGEMFEAAGERAAFKLATGKGRAFSVTKKIAERSVQAAKRIETKFARKGKLEASDITNLENTTRGMLSDIFQVKNYRPAAVGSSVAKTARLYDEFKTVEFDAKYSNLADRTATAEIDMLAPKQTAQEVKRGLLFEKLPARDPKTGKLIPQEPGRAEGFISSDMKKFIADIEESRINLKSLPGTDKTSNTSFDVAKAFRTRARTIATNTKDPVEARYAWQLHDSFNDAIRDIKHVDPQFIDDFAQVSRDYDTFIKFQKAEAIRGAFVDGTNPYSFGQQFMKAENLDQLRMVKNSVLEMADDPKVGKQALAYWGEYQDAFADILAQRAQTSGGTTLANDLRKMSQTPEFQDIAFKPGVYNQLAEYANTFGELEASGALTVLGRAVEDAADLRKNLSAMNNKRGGTGTATLRRLVAEAGGTDSSLAQSVRASFMEDLLKDPELIDVIKRNGKGEIERTFLNPQKVKTKLSQIRKNDLAEEVFTGDDWIFLQDLEGWMKRATGNASDIGTSLAIAGVGESKLGLGKARWFSEFGIMRNTMQAWLMSSPVTMRKLKVSRGVHNGALPTLAGSTAALRQMQQDMEGLQQQLDVPTDTTLPDGPVDVGGVPERLLRLLPQ